MGFRTSILKLFYRSFLLGFPNIVYNPFNVNINTFYSPYNVEPYSTYVNYKLNVNEFNYMNDFLYNKTDKLSFEKIKITEEDDIDDYFLSVNIYNCSSPLFALVGEKYITRCEINTYIKDDNNITGTLILDYTSNMLSMDPVNVFKYPLLTTFRKKDNMIFCQSKSDNIEFYLYYGVGRNDYTITLNNSLHIYSDNIFYMNGVYDKLYYDRSLINADTRKPRRYGLYFKFGDLLLKRPESIFYFKNDIKFAGSLWHNLLNTTL